ncbi:MAG: type II secretion system F family protein, partial [Acidimicrobiales bacterium]
VVWAAGGGAGAVLAMVALSAIGLPVPLGPAVVVGGVAALLASCAPPVVLRSAVRKRREDFLHALSAFVDLVAIGLAGGQGLDQALEAAAGTGSGWGFGELRRALALAAARGETPWAALADLGRTLGVPELEELAASVTLAGTDGARITTSIRVKARSMREHVQARIEADAEAAGELMSLALMVLLAGLVLFIAYPAAASFGAGG